MKSLFKNLIPQWLRGVIRVIKVLEIDYNHFNSARLRSCIARDGLPLPWYTYPTIEYLNQLDFTDSVVFEYGGGNSTFYWASRAKEVICLEDDAEWAEHIRNAHHSNVSVRYVSDKEAYVTEISQYSQGFDVIVVDGAHSRCKCAQAALAKLNPGGMIILDNSDHYFRTAQVLREANLIQVDMTGFGPIQGCSWTTSLFLHREFNTPPIKNIQPKPGIGSSLSNEKDRMLHEGDC